MFHNNSIVNNIILRTFKNIFLFNNIKKETRDTIKQSNNPVFINK